MVDVTDKPITARRAVARARIRLSAPAFAAVLNGEHPKGDVLAVARIAMPMREKRRKIHIAKTNARKTKIE